MKIFRPRCLDAVRLGRKGVRAVLGGASLLGAMLFSGPACADALEESDGVLVKTGPGTLEIDASAIGSRSVRVAEGRLKITQSPVSSARYVRFRIRETNPWYTTNAGHLREMQSFQLVKGEEIVAYPEGTSVTNLGNVESENDPANILVYDRRQDGDWLCSSDDPGFVIDMKQNVSFNGYVIAGAYISTGRSPYSFTVEIGVDGDDGSVEWFLFDDKTQYYTAGYGKDYFTGENGYAPRMPPVYAHNPLAVFGEQAVVEVGEDAALELAHVAGRLPNLSGAGAVILDAACVALTGQCSFTGSFGGVGAVAFETENEKLPPFSFDTLAIRLENRGKPREMSVAGPGTKKLPLVYDSATAPLDLILQGRVETPGKPLLADKFGQPVAFVRHGKTTYCDHDTDVAFVAASPAIAKHIRFSPICAMSSLISQTQELAFFLDGAPVSLKDSLFMYADASKTTNYTMQATSDQNVSALTKKDANAIRLFDADATTYYQYNNGNTGSGFGGAWENTPALHVCFEKTKAFDAFVLWQPTYAIANNPGYWIAMWRIEASFDGNTWEMLSDRSHAPVSASDLYTGWPPVVEKAVAEGRFPRGGAWLAPDAFAVTKPIVLAGELKYLRLNITELANGHGETNGSSYIEIAELELHKDGQKVPWPEGTVAYRTDGSKTPAPGLVNAPVAMPNDNINNGYAENKTADGGGDADQAQTAVWDPGYETLKNGAGFIVEMPAAVAFDSYKIYAGYNWDGTYRTLSKWTFDVSYDGQAWYPLDVADREQNLAMKVVWVSFQHYATRTADSAGAMPFQSDFFADDKPVALAETAVLAVTNAQETLYALSGSGTLELGARASLTLRGDSTFSGTARGAGTLIVDGAHLTLSHANLRGLSRIELRNGATLSGKAYFTDGLVVACEAGCTNNLLPVSFMMLIVK